MDEKIEELREYVCDRICLKCTPSRCESCKLGDLTGEIVQRYDKIMEFEELEAYLARSEGFEPINVIKDELEYQITGRGNCPVLSTDMVKKYDVSESQIKRFCNLGCSTICMDLFEELVKKKLKRRK